MVKSNDKINLKDISENISEKFLPLERVELHCHTKMSINDGISDVKDIIRKAKEWGMPAIAITDHGCIQAFSDAAQVLVKDDLFKIIYGMERYLVDDMKPVVENSNNQSIDAPWVVLDVETTGFEPWTNQIIKIDAVRVEQGIITERFESFVNPGEPISFDISQLTGIDDCMVQDAPDISVVLPKIIEFCHGAMVAADHISFDVRFILWNAMRLGLQFAPTTLDIALLARVLLPQLNRYKIESIAKALNISQNMAEEEQNSIDVTAEILVTFLKLLKERGITSITELNSLSSIDEEYIKKLPTYHVSILVKNEVGLRNLFHLVFLSHTQYFKRVPRIPKSLLHKYREGLLIGSACDSGELYQMLLSGLLDTELERIINFYDYLEIQPLANNSYLLNKELPMPMSKSEEDLRELNRRIVRLGELFTKPVCATSDALYLHTTEEMLTEFAYLGVNKASEVVITNTRKVADMCEKITSFQLES